MPSYSGKFQYLDASGSAFVDQKTQQGACEISFDTETCSITPAAGTPLTFDLGDIDLLAPAEWDLTLQLFTGNKIQLRQFGPVFGRMCEELLAAWRDRTVRCLLLEDLEEVARFTASANGVPVQIRIYESNLAVLPLNAPAIQWRLAELDSIAFDPSTYAFNLLSGASKLVIAKLAGQTGEFDQKLSAALTALRRRSAEALHQTFPFLDPGQLQQLVTLAPEGRSVKLSALAAVHPKLPEALISRAVDEPLKPYFDSLRKRAREESLMTGFKFVRPDEVGVGAPAENAAENGAANPPENQTETTAGTKPPLFFWFFFPLAGQDPLAGKDIVAWEATTGSGRATYFFRAAPPFEDSIARLTRGLALDNFRREPIYLPDSSLDQQSEFHRYAIARRKLPDLAALRAAFLGRAAHSSLETWEQQVAVAFTNQRE